jgi:aspartyl-tRNA(Asn)/glutamyl-tRNA(Gln) amidotransferase subunit B
VTDYEVVIGLEVHAQLLTKTKLFCGCSTNFGQPPNTNICPVCLGLPGSLPVINGQAVELAVKAALALGCTIHESSIFARKNYFYPDLPKGYQISQFEEPFSTRGHLDIEVDGKTKRVGITRAHMEEDAGKNLHGMGGDSVVDLNRAGTPLVEIVGEPDLRSSAEAAAYLRTVRDLLVFSGVNDGNLEEGPSPSDANGTIRPRASAKLGTRCQLNNTNPIRYVQRAIDAEVARQAVILDGGGTIKQETRSFDPDTGQTATLRSKEDAHDYRYFPEPDLPPLVIDEALLAHAKATLPESPSALRSRWTSELGLTLATASTLTGHPAYVRFFETARKGFKDASKAANFVANEVLRGAKTHGLQATFTVAAEDVHELLSLVESGQISGKQAKEVFAAMEAEPGKSPALIVQEKGLKVVSDSGAIEGAVRKVVASFPDQVATIRAGKKGVIGFLVGQVMKEMAGSGDPKLVNELLNKILAES